MNPAEHLRTVRRVPTTVLTVGPVLTVAVVLALSWNEPGGYATSISEATAWSTFGTGAIVGIIIAASLSAWFVPRLSAVVLAISLQPWATEPIDHPVYTALAWIWPIIVVADLLAVLTQRARADSTGLRPDSPRRVEVMDTPIIRSVIGGLLVAAAVAGLGIWLHQRAELTELGRRAVPGVGVVTSQDTAFDSVDMRVSGKVYEFFVNDASDYPVGSSVPVMIDPLGERRPYNSEDADPDGWADIAVPIGAALFVAMLILWVPFSRRSRLRRMAAKGPAWMPVLARPHPTNEGVEVFAVDDVDGSGHTIFLPHLEPVVPVPDDPPGSLASRFTANVALWWDVLRSRAWDDEDDDEYDGDDPDDDSDEWEAAWTGPGLGQPGRADVAGLAADGDICLIRFHEEDDIWWASVRPARDRWTVQLIWLTALSRLPRARRGTSDDDAPPHGIPLTFIWPALLRRTAVAAPAVMIVTGFLLVRWWLVGEPLLTQDLFANIEVAWLAVLNGWLASSWWVRRLPPVRANRFGLGLTSPVTDVLVPAAEIVELQRHDHGLDVTLVDGAFTIFVALDRHEQDRRAVLDDAEAIVRRVHRGSRVYDKPPRWLPRRWVSSATVVAAATTAVTILPALVRF